MRIDELTEGLFQALQGISSCPRGCKCCPEHGERMREALAEFLERWRQGMGSCEECDD